MAATVLVVRLLSWNLHGAAVPGRATLDQQHRAWTYIRDLGADIVLAQEVASKGIPPWARDEWTIVQGERGVHRKTWHWGSVIAARLGLNLRFRSELLADPWLAQMYDLVLVGQIELGGGPVVLASVHSPAVTVRSWVNDYADLPLGEDESEALKRPGCPDEPYYNDFAFTALARHVAGARFVVGGDWNTCRKYDTPRSRAGSAFFERAAAHGWVECHREPEEASFLGRATATYQLDHAFCDSTTAATVTACRVVLNDVVRAVSDHAPLVVDFEPEPR
jgi:endonuclease/exonuclease/phosphatase family metal-dependent hydrolase